MTGFCQIVTLITSDLHLTNDLSRRSSPIIKIDDVAQYDNIHILIILVACTVRKYYLQCESSSRLTPRRVFSLLCLPVSLSTTLSRPNRTCIQHTMRFTTWSTLTNAFIISTVALLSLIQAVNAFDPELFIMSPNGFQPPLVPGDLMTVRWYVPNRAGSQGQDRSLMTGISGPSTTILNYLDSILWWTYG